MTGRVRAARAAAPSAGSWLIRWTSSRRLLDLLAAEARTAAGQRELPDGTDAAQLAFELGVILAGTDIVSVLHDDRRVISRARTAIRTRLTR
jgi:hypothetical protein